jgi:hypothetical protein
MLLDVHPLIEVAIWVAFAFGGLLCLMNFSLPVRYYYRRWKGLPEERYVSSIPLLGSLCVFLTLRALDVIPAVKVIGWMLIAIDVGGIHWMMFSLAFYALRALVKKTEGPKLAANEPSINLVAVAVFILIALGWLVMAFTGI